MPAALAFVPAWAWRWIAIAGIGLACMAYGAFKMHQHDQIAYNELATEFGEFKGKAKAAAEDYENRRLAKEAKDRQDKEKADAQNKRDLSDMRTELERLRHERDSSRSIVPERPSGSKCPDGQACFDRPLLEQALRDYRSAIRRLVDEGSEITIDLDTAKRWSRGE